MHSWQADVRRASDHVFGSFLSPPVLLIQRAAKQTETPKPCKDVVKVRQEALEGLLHKWPPLPSCWPAGRCAAMKEHFSCFLPHRSGPGRSSEALQKQQNARSFQITPPPRVRLKWTILRISVDFLRPLIKLSNK